MTMSAPHAPARSQRRKRLRATFACIAASLTVTACGDDASSNGSQDLQQQQARRAQQAPLATTFNAVPA
jgi:hypothetical protein